MRFCVRWCLVELWAEQAGDGPSVVFLHASVADSRMWEPQWHAFQSTHHVVRCDFRGFGRTGLEAGEFSHSDDVLELFDRLDLDHAVIVGASMGGRVALELAIRAPRRVDGLLLSAPGLPGHEWSEVVQEFWRAEDEAMERGDIDAAVELNLTMWLDGPHRQQANVDDATRALVAEMQRTAIEHFLLRLTDAIEQPAVGDLAARLGEVEPPTTVLVGDQDVSDLRDIATAISSSVSGATLHIVPDAAHLPSLEAPDVFNDLLRQLLV